MVSHWLNALKVGLFGKRKATTRITRRPTLHVEGLEGRWVPSASPVVASIVGVTGTPTVTDVQDLKADRAFAARLEARLDHVRADVTHDANDIEADMGRVSRLEARMDRVQKDIAHDSNLKDLTADTKRLLKLETWLSHAREDLTHDKEDLEADRAHASSLETRLDHVRADIALDRGRVL